MSFGKGKGKKDELQCLKRKLQSIIHNISTHSLVLVVPPCDAHHNFRLADKGKWNGDGSVVAFVDVAAQITIEIPLKEIERRKEKVSSESGQQDKQ